MRISILSVKLFRKRGRTGRSSVPAIAGMLFVSWLALGGVAGSSTGGTGGNDIEPVSPLVSQASLVHSACLELLVAVSAGDNTVTAFDTSLGPQPRRTVVTSSGGLLPVSVAFSEDVLYVLNAGGSGTIATFAVTAGGQALLTVRLDDAGIPDGSRAFVSMLPLAS